MNILISGNRYIIERIPVCEVSQILFIPPDFVDYSSKFHDMCLNRYLKFS